MIKCLAHITSTGFRLPNNSENPMKQCPKARRWRSATDLTSLTGSFLTTLHLQGLQGAFAHSVHVPGLCLSPCPSALKASWHQCVLEETQAWNTVELLVNGMVIFTWYKPAPVWWECAFTVVEIWGRFSSFLVFFYRFNVVIENWIVFAKRLIPLWRMLTDELKYYCSINLKY